MCAQKNIGKLAKYHVLRNMTEALGVDEVLCLRAPSLAVVAIPGERIAAILGRTGLSPAVIGDGC